MKLSEWIKTKSDENATKIRSLKNEKKKHKGQRDEAVIEREKLSKKIAVIEADTAKLKRLEKKKLVRLDSGAIISISVLDAMMKKLNKAKFNVALIVHEDAIVLEYDSRTSKGKLTLSDTQLDIPHDVEIEPFNESEIRTCYQL